MARGWSARGNRRRRRPTHDLRGRARRRMRDARGGGRRVRVRVREGDHVGGQAPAGGTYDRRERIDRDRPLFAPQPHAALTEPGDFHRRGLSHEKNEGRLPNRRPSFGGREVGTGREASRFLTSSLCAAGEGPRPEMVKKPQRMRFLHQREPPAVAVGTVPLRE